MKVVLLRTGNTDPWTQHAARRRGIAKAASRKLLLIDVDHIATKLLIEQLLETDRDVMKFRRCLGILDAKGSLKTDRKTLADYGAGEFLKRHGRRIHVPGNCFMMDKQLYLAIAGKGRFWQTVRKLGKKGRINMYETDERPMIYAFPNGPFCGDFDADPLALFHGLSRRNAEYAWSNKSESL
jgi:hypothetical protein